MSAPRLDDATFEIAGYEFGFADRLTIKDGVATGVSVAEAGPFGTYRIPLTADVAWAVLIGSCAAVLSLALLIARRRQQRLFSTLGSAMASRRLMISSEYNVPMLAFVHPPLPGWAWVISIVGGVALYIIDRVRDRNRYR